MTDEQKEDALEEFIYKHLTNTWVFNPYFLEQTTEYTVNLEDE